MEIYELRLIFSVEAERRETLSLSKSGEGSSQLQSAMLLFNLLALFSAFSPISGRQIVFDEGSEGTGGRVLTGGSSFK